MKKLILLFMFFWGLTSIYAQKESQPKRIENEFNLSPDGLFDKVFDHYGNSYELTDLLIGKEERSENNQKLRFTNPAPLNCGYYNVYFEVGSGMEDNSNPIHLERRNVLCRVLTDLSNFINSPLTTNGLNNKVNIWVRNINNVITAPNSPNGVLGLASSFYTMPYNNITGFGGIVDNEIWKTIHLGRDSYTNVVTPLVSSGSNAGQSGNFYHGMMAFNFYDSVIDWNTNLSITSFPNLYDFYSVILHEMTHALGFASLINSNGLSKFGTGYNYFSRYDTRLKNNPNTQFLINRQTNACGSMYNYTFNNNINTNILQPISNACNNKVRYVGLSNVPVHTPIAFSPPSSLSHFEGVCVSPNPSFVMENAIGKNVIRRFLKPQERNVLGDLGYNVKTSYGVSSTYLGSTTYSGTLSGVNVAGINDGIDINGNYLFTGDAGSDIVINGAIHILSNDINAISFECLEDVFDSTANLSVTSGDNNTAITFNSSVLGLHLLRYVPINAIGQRGNITYTYIYVTNINNCALQSNGCNLVFNGNFEENIGIPSSNSQMNLVCGWFKANNGTPEYYHRDSQNLNASLPCNLQGFEEDNLNLNAYVGTFIVEDWNINDNFIENASEVIGTRLKNKLQPNISYQLSFDVSLAEGYSFSGSNLQAYLSENFTPYNGYNGFPVNNPDLLFTNPTVTLLNEGWERIVFNIPPRVDANEEFLFIGGIDFSELNFVQRTPVTPTPGLCNFINLTNNPSYTQSMYSYYYIDNVTLVPLDGTFTLPVNICSNESINDLSNFLNAVPFNGTFSGNGVTGNTFDASAAGIGNQTIDYTYTNLSGCSVTIYGQIEVLSLDDPLCINNCPDNLIFSSTENSTLITYNTSNFIETNTNYLVNSSSDISLKAGNFIVIKPESQINSGSHFFARIENCDGSQTGKMFNSVTEIIKKPKIFSLPRNIDSSNINENSEFDESFDILGLLISPNPSKGLVNIVTSLDGELQVNIFDMYGKEVINTKVTDNFLNTSNLASGIYIIKITERGKTASRKLVIN